MIDRDFEHAIEEHVRAMSVKREQPDYVKAADAFSKKYEPVFGDETPEEIMADLRGEQPASITHCDECKDLRGPNKAFAFCACKCHQQPATAPAPTALDLLERVLAEVNAVKQSKAVSRDRAAAAGREIVSSHRQSDLETCEEIERRIRATAALLKKEGRL